MRLQKNTLLALYSVIEFASDPARHVSAAEIADKHGVSAHHLAKVLADLARAGVVESTRGVGGGYRFAGNARRLTLMDVIALFEHLDDQARDSPHKDDVDTTTGPNPGAPSARAIDRALGAVLSEIDEITKATFRSITLATMLRLVERQQGNAQAAPPVRAPAVARRPSGRNPGKGKPGKRGRAS